MPSRPDLDRLGWIDVLQQCPALAGSTRFLSDYFLPDHGELRRDAYERALVRASSADDALRSARLKRLLGDYRGARSELEPYLKRSAGARVLLAEMDLVADPEKTVSVLKGQGYLGELEYCRWLWLGYGLLLCRREAEAHDYLSRAVELQGPRRRGAQLLRALVRQRRGDWRGSGEDLTGVLAANARCAGAFAWRALARFHCGDTEGALSDCHQGVTLHPENLDGYYRILFASENLPQQNLGHLEKVVQLAAIDGYLRKRPNTGWALALRAEAQRRTGFRRFERSVRQLKKAVEHAPDAAWIRAFYGRALSSFERNPARMSEALRQLRLASHLNPRSAWIGAWKAEILRRMGDNRASRIELTTAIANDPSYKPAYGWRGEAARQLKLYPQAITDFSTGLRLRPDHAWLYHQRALARWAYGAKQAALEDLLECSRRGTYYRLGYGGLLGAVPSLSWLNLKELVGARLTKGAPVVRYWRARLRLNEGRAQEALDEGLSDAGPDMADLVAALRMEAYVRLGRFPEALKQAKEADDAAGSLLWKAAAYRNGGRTTIALETLRRAIRSEQNAPELVLAGAKRIGLPAGPGPMTLADKLLFADCLLRGGDDAGAERLLKGVGRRRLGAAGLAIRALAAAQSGHHRLCAEDVRFARRLSSKGILRALEVLFREVPSLTEDTVSKALLALLDKPRF